MKNLIATQYFLNEINQMRKAIHENLIALMEKHNAREVDCYEHDDCPIIFNGMDDDCMTLDSIEVITTSNVKCIHFNCSDSYNDDYTTPNSMDIELLINTYEWIMANEEFLFNQDNEE